MSIIIKFTLRNIKENKFRTFLILLSIIFSTALFFGSTSLAGTIEKTYTEMLKKYFGSAEIMIYPDQNSPTDFVTDSKLAPFQKDLAYAVGVMHGSGIYKVTRDEVVRFQILGYDLEGLQKMHQFLLAGEDGLVPFKGHQLIISRDTAEKYNLALGQMLDLEINGQTCRSKVSGIAQPVGLFREDGQTVYAVMPREFLGALYQARNKANTIYLKLQDPAKKERLMEQLAAAYPRYKVEETIREADLKAYTERMTQPFLMMLTSVLMISVFIIYTSFKVIALERIPVMGTFRSVGATRKMVTRIFLAESLAYGVIGGLAGCGLGIGVLHIMARLTTPNWIQGLETKVIFSFSQLATAFFMALILSLVSSFLPIWRVSKIPVKDIILNITEQQKSSKRWKYWLGVVFVLLPLILPPLVSRSLVMPIGTLCLIMGLSGIILLLPLLIKFLILALEGVYLVLFGNEGILALKNLRDNKSIVNNIALLAIGIASLLLIKVVGKSVMTEITSFFRNWDFQILAAPYNADRDSLSSFRSIKGVKDVYGSLTAANVEVLGTSEKIGTIEGINLQTFEFMNLEIPGEPNEIVRELDAGRNIILSTMLRDRLGSKKGDVITLKTERGNAAYTVIGFMNTIENNGQYAIVSDRYLKLDMQLTTYNMLYIKTDHDVAAAQQNINKKFNRNPFWNETVGGIEERNNQMNGQMFAIMDAFSYLTIVIGIFGVFNNFIISLLERRRSLAVLRSVGLSKKQMRRMLLLEAMSGGLIGGVCGVLGGLLITSIIPYILRSMGLKGTLLYSPSLFGLAVLASIFIAVTASISPTLRTSKMSIITSLKYE